MGCEAAPYFEGPAGLIAASYLDSGYNCLANFKYCMTRRGNNPPIRIPHEAATRRLRPVQLARWLCQS